MTRVLFLCVHNSARSQMAEAFLKKHGGGRFQAESAGLEPGGLNPFVVRAMAELGIDLSGNPTKSVFDLRAAGRTYEVVVTVLAEVSTESIVSISRWPSLTRTIMPSAASQSGVCQINAGDHQATGSERCCR